MAGCLEQKVADALLCLASVPPSSAAFMVLVDYTNYPLCKNLRDKIYAILSLLSFEMQATFKPDYTISVEDVYKDICQWCIKYHRSLEVLLRDAL
jgi:hypothetical protein